MFRRGRDLQSPHGGAAWVTGRGIHRRYVAFIDVLNRYRDRPIHSGR
jgi:hypothetical protein